MVTGALLPLLPPFPLELALGAAFERMVPRAQTDRVATAMVARFLVFMADVRVEGCFKLQAL